MNYFFLSLFLQLSKIPHYTILQKIGDKIICASLCYTIVPKLRTEYVKIYFGLDVLVQIVCPVKIRHYLTKEDNGNFTPIATKYRK